MRGAVLAIVLSLVVITGATAGKNVCGALVVHTDDDFGWRYWGCDPFDQEVPQDCAQLNTRTDLSQDYPAYIWLIAAFDETCQPGVSSIYFGIDHNLPTDYYNRWGYCGPSGTTEDPDPDWPNDPLNAGNQVTFGTPIVGDRFFPFYYVSVWGFEGVYYGTDIHAQLGYASFLDDSVPPHLDTVWRFGQVRWYEPGHNVCPGGTPQDLMACCFEDGRCAFVFEAACVDLNGQPLGPGTECDPNPCPQSVLGVCCMENGACRIETPSDCQYIGGVYQGGTSECEPNPCPQPPLGACCLQSGDCMITIDPYCDSVDGVFLGDGIECEPNPCYGACCFYNGDCQMQALYWCEPMGGEFMGAGSDCDPNPCDPTSSVPEISVREATWGKIKSKYR